jgi:hypothetical protein
MAVGAVSCEPLSRRISLIHGNKQGIFVFWQGRVLASKAENRRFPIVSLEIPCEKNREISPA